MTSTTIYSVLYTKPHNKHYLDRYIKHIEYCIAKNVDLCSDIYTEKHHIVPKSKDLFPEYASLRKHPWNCAKLTFRQHFIAHWMLWKAFGGRQTYAFMSMANNMIPKQMKRDKVSLNSKVYAAIKEDTRKLGFSRKGLAPYRNAAGETIVCYTNDPRVLSGELISTSKNRRYKWNTTDRSKSSRAIRAYKWLTHPIRKISLYFLDMKITLVYTEDNFTFLPYLDQGWSFKQTPEHKTRIALESNKNQSTESRKAAGRAISESCKRRKALNLKRKPRSKESIKNQRNKSPEQYIQLYYNPESNLIVECDILDIKESYIKCFSRPGRLIWDKDGNKRSLDKRVPIIPSGYYATYPFEVFAVFDTVDKNIKKIAFKDITPEHIILKVPNGDRVLYWNMDTNTQVYLTNEFISMYGVPLNCRKN